MIAAADLRYRPTIATDGPALFKLFEQVHTTEIATLAVDAATRAAFASMQYVEQRVRTSAEFPDAVDVAIENGDRLCGRMMSVMRDGGLQLIQLGVLVEHRRQGIGTQAMRRLARIAEEHGCPIWLRADAASAGCRDFLERVGFSVTGHGGRLLVEPARATAAA
ncbi:hypothetical protein GCM10028798_11000 [Humibacter antri]